MITAFLKGKLSLEQENMEDILTSTVFDSFKSIGVESGLFQFLKAAQPYSGSNPLLDNERGWTVHFEDYQFWPTWTDLPGVDNCEPDVVIRIRNDDETDVIVCIEAKYLSGKSSTPSLKGSIRDQLAKQWMHVAHIARENEFEPWLIYLTAQTAMPKDELEQSVGELKQKLNISDERLNTRISWLSWRQLDGLFDKADIPSLTEIGALVRYLGLSHYHGIGPLKCLAEFNYRFREGIKRYRWQFEGSRHSKWVYTK